MGTRAKQMAEVFSRDQEKRTSASDYDEGDGEDTDDNDMPSDFEAAYSDYNDNPTSKNMWAMIQCAQGSRMGPNRG